MAEQITIPTKGDVIAGKYRVNHELGRGAYGIVFLCEQEEIGRDVAVKTLLPQAFLQGDVVQRFHREAQLISRLDHPNVIRLFDYGVDEGLLYMTVEYVLGDTLAEIIEKEAPLDLDRVLNITHQILNALEHAHANGIVHRDLKPENIVILETTESHSGAMPLPVVGDGPQTGLQVKVLDFGISKVMLGDDHSAMNTLTQDGTVLGTPHYMSPENIIGDAVDHRADIYALGIIIYEMLTGEHPFDAPSPSAVFVRHLRDEPPPLPDHLKDSAIGVAVFGALKKQPDDRIGSAAEFRRILESDPDTMAEWAAPPTKSARAIWWVAATLLLVVASLVAWKIGWAPSPGETTTNETVEPKEVVETDNAVEELIIEEDDLDPLVEPEFVQAMTASDTLLSQALFFANKEQEREALALAAAADKRGKRDKRDPKEKRDKKIEKKDPDDKVEKAAKVLVRISSTPSNAKVFINGVPIGSTPVSKLFDDPEKKVTAKFTLLGYKSKTKKFSPKNKSLSVTLEKERIGFGD